MSREYYDLFEYDVALSFAAPDEPTARELGRLLTGHSLHVFLDRYPEDDPAAQSVLNHLVNLVARKARLCVVLLSSHYPLEQWTAEDRDAIRERAFRDPDEYLLFLGLDESRIPGVVDLRQQPLEEVAARLEQKIRLIRHRPGPPTQSHDLRSGNVPPVDPAQEDDPDFKIE